MKGIETMPIKILLTLLIVAIVIGVSFWQLNFFLGFKTEKDFKEDLTNLYQTIKTTQSFGDEGSFTTVWVTVPAGMSFNISVDGDNVTADVKGEKFFYNFTANVTAVKNDTTLYLNDTALGPAIFGPGQYTLRLYYGDAPNDQKKIWTIYFK